MHKYSTEKSTFLWIALFVSLYLCILGIWASPLYSERISPSFDFQRHSFYYKPYLSLYLADQIHQLFGVRGIAVIGQILLPASVFGLLVVIFLRYVALLWAVGLALLAVSSIDGYPFREFLLQIIGGDSWRLLGSSNLPELLHFPIPSFSTFYFLGVFFFATRLPYVQLGEFKKFLITIFVSLTIYVDAIDAPFALAFWGLLMLLRAFSEKESAQVIIIKLLCQALIVAIVLFPALYFGGVNFGTPSPFSLIGYYYLSAYFIIPISLIVILYFIQRIDPYELLRKFYVVYALMATEFFIVLLSLFGVVSIDLTITQNRIVQFFTHSFYYIPVIYYSSRTYMRSKLGLEGSSIGNWLRFSLHMLFGILSNIYLSLIVFFLFLYNFSSSIHYLNGYENLPFFKG